MGNKVDKLLVLITLSVFIAVSAFVGITASPVMGAAVHIDTEGQPTIGSLAAPVELVVFEDMKCVWCARFSTEVYPKIKKKYVDTGKVRYTMVPLAFLAGSRPAGQAVLEVWHQNRDLFFPYVEVIYSQQPPESQDWATQDTMLTFATQVNGINLKQLARAIKQAKYSQDLDRNFLLAKRVMKDDFGTPTLYVNGRRVHELEFGEICNCIEKVLQEEAKQ